jgi:hypothetical protein
MAQPIDDTTGAEQDLSGVGLLKDRPYAGLRQIGLIGAVLSVLGMEALEPKSSAPGPAL